MLVTVRLLRLLLGYLWMLVLVVVVLVLVELGVDECGSVHACLLNNGD